jgi:hypothetical protein
VTDVTRILSDLEDGDPHAAGQLLPLVYDELRVPRLAGERVVLSVVTAPASRACRARLISCAWDESKNRSMVTSTL